MSRISKQTGKKGAGIAAPPLPHEVDLVAPPVLTQPSLPSISQSQGNTKWLYSVAAVAMLGVSFATVATLTATVHRQLATTSPTVPDIESVVETVKPTPTQETTEVLTPVVFTEPTNDEPPSVALEVSDPVIDELFDALPQPPEPSVVARMLPPHDAEETSCPAEDATPTEPLLALLDVKMDPWVEAREEVGGEGTIGCEFRCDLGVSLAAPVAASTCENGTCPVPQPFTDPRSFGTKIVFAENMKQARELAIDQDKLLFVMHVSGNFAIEGFT